MERESMKRFCLAVTIILAAAGLYPGLLRAHDNPGPKIAAKELTFNAGQVASGTAVDHVFEVRNAGNEPLIIDRVVPS